MSSYEVSFTPERKAAAVFRKAVLHNEVPSKVVLESAFSSANVTAENIDAAATNFDAAVADFNDAADDGIESVAVDVDDGAAAAHVDVAAADHDSSIIPASFFNVKTGFAAIFLLSAGVVFIFGAARMSRLEDRLQQLPQQLQRDMRQQLREFEESHAVARSRGKRGGVGEEDTVEEVMKRKDVINVVSDIARTDGGTGYEGRDSFPARFVDLKWRLSGETPSIPLNHAVPRGVSARRALARWASARRSVRLGTAQKDAENVEVTGTFAFDQDKGIVTVNENGLYFIFSQVTFYSLAPRMEYSIHVNGETSVTCKNEQQISISACDSYQGVNRDRCLASKNLLNSCQTGGLRLLLKGDQVGVSSSKPQQKAIVGSKYSFFGILKV